MFTIFNQLLVANVRLNESECAKIGKEKNMLSTIQEKGLLRRYSTTGFMV